MTIGILERLIARQDADALPQALFGEESEPEPNSRRQYHATMADPEHPYVSRGGLKLAAALDAFAIDPRGLACADLGSNVGGFVDCLLQRGAAKVFAVDTGYGTLAWKLRNDPRVVVCERTNAVHTDPWQSSLVSKHLPFVGVDLVSVDLGWTRQELAVPAALRWLRPRTSPNDDHAPPRMITLIKPHYEATREELAGGDRGVLDERTASLVMERVLSALPALGVTVQGHILSPVRGGASRGREGNVEYLAWLTPVAK